MLINLYSHNILIDTILICLIIVLCCYLKLGPKTEKDYNDVFVCKNKISIFLSNTNIINSRSRYLYGVKTLFIPSHIERIDDNAFFGNSKLKRIIFEKNSNLTSIGNYAFCFSSIEDITIPASVVDLNKKWCAKTPNLTKISVNSNNKIYIYYEDSFILKKTNSCTNTYDSLVFSRRDIKKPIIPSFIQKIDPFAFESCNQLQTISFPYNSELNVIEESAFANSSLKIIKIPSSVNYIAPYAFSFCKNCYEVEIPIDSKLEKIEKNAFDYTTIEKISIPQNVLVIGERSFSNCSRLKHVSFSDDAKLLVIHNYAFNNTNISSISIPSSVLVLGDQIFRNCKNLQIIELPNNKLYFNEDDLLYCFSSLIIMIPSFPVFSNITS